MYARGESLVNSAEQFRAAILPRLASVIDPATGMDVVRMRLIEDLTFASTTVVDRPSSIKF
ncbi:MAG: iron-sulfur cluster assembly protein [Chloroflexi bacterium]|nr:iron-sulfur cluster assembly protein [Chloroflexota bacterium]